MMRGIVSPVLAPMLAALAACGTPGDAPVPPTERFLRIVAGDGHVLAVARIDGGIDEERVGSFTGPGDQRLLLTSRVGGGDQCSVIVFSEGGERFLTHRPPSVSPWQQRHEFLTPYAPLVAAVARPSGRFLVVGTINDFAATRLAVLEATTPRELEERLVFWNSGHFHRIAMNGTYLVVAGGNNALEPPAATIAIFAWSDIESGTTTGQSPAPDGGRGFLRYFRLPPTAQGKPFGITDLTFESGHLVATTGSGLRWILTLPDGPFRAESTGAFPSVYKGQAPLKEFLASLPKNIRVWR